MISSQICRKLEKIVVWLIQVRCSCSLFESEKHIFTLISKSVKERINFPLQTLVYLTHGNQLKKGTDISVRIVANWSERYFIWTAVHNFICSFKLFDTPMQREFAARCCFCCEKVSVLYGSSEVAVLMAFTRRLLVSFVSPPYDTDSDSLNLRKRILIFWLTSLWYWWKSMILIQISHLFMLFITIWEFLIFFPAFCWVILNDYTHSPCHVIHRCWCG